MQKILSGLRKVCQEYNLIENGDKIAVGVSGGKDSLTLLTALAKYQTFASESFSLEAIAVDLSNGKMDFSTIADYCKQLNAPFTLIPSNVFEVVFDIRKEKNPCSLCANMRRGILNSTAKSLDCNKVALGHHKDDLIETFLISLFFEERISTFKPKTYLSKTDLHVIRPLLYCSEQEIENVSKNIPIVKNVCPVDKHTERERAKALLSQLDKIYPNCKEKIFNAIIHKERYNLF